MLGKMKKCAACMYHDQFSGACCNGESDYVADFTDDNFSCGKFAILGVDLAQQPDATAYGFPYEYFDDLLGQISKLQDKIQQTDVVITACTIARETGRTALSVLEGFKNELLIGKPVEETTLGGCYMNGGSKAMEIELIHAPNDEEKMLFKRAIWVTMGRTDVPKYLPSDELLHKCLVARHSPIRELHFVFLMKGIPSNTSVHFCRHVHAQPYVSSLRNDRQEKMDGDLAPRNTPVDMILSVNAEELMIMANKRLCTKAAAKTREVMRGMCDLAEKEFPAIKGCLVPMCEYHGNVCHEIDGCGKCPNDLL